MRGARKGRPAEQDRRSRLKQLRKAGARRLAELDLPRLCDVTELCRHLGEVRGRPITLVPMQMPASHPCGMWVAARDEDLIFYDANTTSAHQEHIILHELGHIICCHRGAGWLDEATARLLFPNLDPDLVRDMLLRATYDDVQEQEAEIIAYLLSQRLHGTDPQDPPPAQEAGDGGDAGKHAMLSRIERTLI
ncbi:toxin [Streptomyces sp. SW4]|nr:toxin [Streptomyces sp. SW4]